VTVTDERLLLLSPQDNVLVAREAIEAGEPLSIEGEKCILATRLERGHKVARFAIRTGEKILKYGAPIGSATAEIAPGAHVHIHNIKSDYTPTHVIEREVQS
jgi:hypothetical protein